MYSKVIDTAKKELIVWLLLFFGSLYFGEYGSGFKSIVFCSLLFGIAISIYAGKKYMQKFFKEYMLDGLICYIASCIVFYCVERINENLRTIEILYLLGNSIVYFTVILFFCLIFQRMRWGLIVGGMVLYLFGVANYYVVLFRGSPIVPGDFFAIQTAGTVLSNYHYEIGWSLYSSTLILFSWFILIGNFLYEKKKERLTIRNIIFEGILLVGLAGMIIKGDFFKPAMDLWNLNSSTSRYGIAVCMISNLYSMRVAAPEGYSYENVKAFGKNYTKKTIVEDGQLPNVVVIMNESFSDLSVLSQSLDSNQYMPYYNSLDDNVVKGMALVSTIGGGTANSEYEFLTGNTMAFIPGTVPYVQFILKNSYSLVQTFRDLGYNTTAIHPYDKKGYNRYKVYPLLGFDSFWGIDDFQNARLERELFITDEESYKKVIEIFESDKESGNPSFIFNVTIQNHSGYATGYYGDNRIKISGMEGEYPEAEEYLTLVKRSDEDLRVLIDYFNSVEEPTVLLFFGDHLPKVEDSFYERMLNKAKEQWTLEDSQKRFKVPFFIWANYEIEERKNVFTSLNYLSGLLFKTAGIPTTAYQDYLMDLSQEIPAMNASGYMSKSGQWYSYKSDNTTEALLDTYWKIQYNNVFAKKKCEQWFSLNRE